MHDFNCHPMRNKLRGAVTMFMRADEDMSYYELEKQFMLAGATELQADEIIGTLGAFRDMVLNLYHEFTFADLAAVVQKRETLCCLISRILNDNLDLMK